jgi:hypothetical protein
MKAAARPSGADSGHRVQIDVKFVESLTISTAGTTAGSSAGAAAGEMRSGWRARTPVHRDRRLHRLRVLRIYPQRNQKIAMQFVDYVPGPVAVKVEVIQTDNGAEFQSAFHWHVLDKHIGHVYIKSRAPDSTAKSNAPTHRCRRILRFIRRRRHRRGHGIQRQTESVGRLLQLPPTPRHPRRANTQ